MNNELLAVIRILREKINLQEKKQNLSKKQKKIAQTAEPKDKITAADFAALRAKKNENLEDVIEEYISSLNERKKRRKRKSKKKEKQKASDLPGYRRGRNKKQLKKLDQVTSRAAAGEFKKSDYEKEDKRRQAELPKGKKTPKNPFSDKIGMVENSSRNLERRELRILLEEIIKSELDERKKRKRRKKKRTTRKPTKRKSKSSKKKKTLSKKTMDTLKRKAKASGYTAGSLAAEYRRGLGAFYTSGSRKGMGAHQWAMARVNSAIGKGNPSWANLKRSKAKKK